MRKLLLLLLTVISVSVSAQYQPSGSKVRYVNGIGLGTKSDAAFGTVDSLVLYAKADSTLMFKYKGTARALAYADSVVRLTGTQTITGTKIFSGYLDKNRTNSSLINVIGYSTAEVDEWNLGQRTGVDNFSITNVITGVEGFSVNSTTDNISIAKNIIFPFTTDSLRGVIYKSTYRFLHDFKNTGADGESVFLGRNAGNFTMSTGGGISSQSSYNTGIGVLSLNSLTQGWSNVGVGYRSLGYTTSGKYNTAVGVHALDNTTTSDRNTAVGHYAAFLNTTGENNTVVGASALRGNITGSNNSFFGLEAGYIAGNVSYNSAFGYRSLYTTQGGYNSAFGMNTLLNSTTAQECVAVGFAAGQLNTTGNKNVFIGTNSGSQNLTGSNNVFLGHESGYHETGDQKLFIDNQGRANEADARLKAMIYGVFNTAVSSQFLNFNVNKLTVNSGTANQNSLLNGTSLSYTRVSDAAPVVYFSKNTDLGAEGTANIYGYDGIQFKTQGAETVKAVISVTGDLTIGATSGTATGNIYAANLASGTYSPTISGASGATSVSASDAQYMRVGNTVTVSGRITATPSSTSAAFLFYMTVPVSSSFSSESQAGGVASKGNDQTPATACVGAISAEGGGSRVLMTFSHSPTTTSGIFFYSFTYQIL